MRKGFTLIELMIVIAIIAIIAAIAIPNLMESRVTANEAAASASLKSGIFAGEVQFQAGGYQDADQDNVGEYGTMGAMSGMVQTTRMTFPAAGNKTTGLKLLQGPLATASNYTVNGAVTANNPLCAVASGYRYTCWVGSDVDNAGAGVQMPWYEGGVGPALPPPAAAPGADANAYTRPNGAAIGAVAAGMLNIPADGSANNGEKFFVFAAMPEKYGDTGRRLFILCQDGQIRSPAKVEAARYAYNAGLVQANDPKTGQEATTAMLVRFVTLAFDPNYAAAAVAAPAVVTITPAFFDSVVATGRQAGNCYFEVYSK